MLPAGLPAHAPVTARRAAPGLLPTSLLSATILSSLALLTTVVGCAATPSGDAGAAGPAASRLPRLPQDTLGTPPDAVDGTGGGFTVRALADPTEESIVPATLLAPDGRSGSRSADVERAGPPPVSGYETLDECRQRLLAELERTQRGGERGDHDREAETRILDRLIALVILEGTPEGDSLEGVLRQLELRSGDDTAESDRRHQLLRAALYESIGLEDRADAALDRLGPRPGSGSLRVGAPIPCTGIEGLGRYTPRDRAAFRPGTELHLYAEVFGIENRVEGDRFRQSLEVELSVLDARGHVRGRQVVEAGTRPTAAPVVDSFLNLRTPLPSDLPRGTATVRLRVTDRLSGAVDHRECRIRIER